jgi:translation elongation factor EF-1alpha
MLLGVTEAPEDTMVFQAKIHTTYPTGVMKDVGVNYCPQMRFCSKQVELKLLSILKQIDPATSENITDASLEKMGPGKSYICRFEAWKPVYTDLAAPNKVLRSVVLTDNAVTYAVGEIIAIG